MRNICLYHHLGLGDHIICNGLVRESARQFDKITIFCKFHNYESVSFMYRDLKNLEILIGNDNYAIDYIRKRSEILTLKIGYMGKEWMRDNSNTFDESFYIQAGLAYQKRWDSFYIKRDMDQEKKLFNLFNVKENDYIFLHDDPNRGYIINPELIRKDISIIRPDKNLTKNIFDYCYLMENSREFHGIDSCFRILVDHIDTKSDLFFHSYAKLRLDSQSKGWGIPQSKKNWIIL